MVEDLGLVKAVVVAVVGARALDQPHRKHINPDSRKGITMNRENLMVLVLFVVRLVIKPRIAGVVLTLQVTRLMLLSCKEVSLSNCKS